MKKKHILTISFLRQFVWALRQSRVVLIAAGVWAAEEGTRQDNRYQNKNLKSISVRLSWVHFDRSAVKFGVAGEKTRDQFDGQTDSLGVKGEWHWNSFPWRQWASLTIPSCISVLRCLDWVQRRRNNLLMTLLSWHQSLSVSFSNGQTRRLEHAENRRSSFGVNATAQADEKANDPKRRGSLWGI